MDDQDWLAISEAFDTVENSPGVKRVDGRTTDGRTWKIYQVAGNYRIDINKERDI